MTTVRVFSILIILTLAAESIGRCQEQSSFPGMENRTDGTHSELGITAGTPSLVNVMVGYWSNQWGFRVTGMTYGANCRGFQLYAGFEFIRDEDHRHCLGLAGGTWHYTHNNWKFLGPAYDLYIGGFFMEFGIGWGNGTYMANQVLWQFGYSFSILEK